MSIKHSVTVLGCSIPGVYSTETRSAHHFEKHWHDVFGFGVLQAGAQQSSSGRGQVEAFPGNVICTNPGEVHDGRPIGPGIRCWRIVSIDSVTIGTLIGLPPGSFEIARPVIQNRALNDAIQQVFDVFDDNVVATDDELGRRLAFEETLTRACTLLVAYHANRPLARDRRRENLNRVRERLAFAGSSAPSLDELALLAGLSRYQVLRQFKREYGLTPHAWLLHLRAERARTLIRQGRSLVDSALLAGFADQSHMTRVFARRFGYTPATWKRAQAAHQSSREIAREIAR